MKFSVDNVIKTTIAKSLQDLGFPEVQISLEHPAVESHGDYSSNIALTVFPSLRAKRGNLVFSSPRQLAETIVAALSSDKELKKVVEKIEVAGPGFVNFYLTKSVLVDELKRIEREKLDFGKRDFLKGKKIMVEYTDPNPFKEFRIGHLFSNTVGEVVRIARRDS